MIIHLHLLQFGLDVWREVCNAASEGVKGHGSEQICTCRTGGKCCKNLCALDLGFAYCDGIGYFFMTQ